MKYSVFTVLTVLTTTLGLCSCAPGFGTRLEMEHVSGVTSSTPDSWRGIRPCLLEVQDQRPSKTLAFVDKRPLEPSGDVAIIVQRALEDTLRAEGAALRCDADSPQLQLVLRRWLADVQPGFPTSDLFAAATMELEVSRQRVLIYRGTYQGTSGIEHPFPRDAQVRRTLEESLQEALRALRADPKLLAAVR